MSNFKYKGKMLRDQYVYYENLKEVHPLMYDYAKGTFYRSINSYEKNLPKVAKYLRSLARAEGRKEQALLNKVFKREIKYNPDDPDSVKEFMNAVNTTLNVKEIYDRNVELQKYTHAKPVYSWFPGYFEKALNEKSEVFDELAKAASELGVDSKEFEKKLNETVRGLVKLGLQKMFTADREHSDMDLKFDNAYLSILKELEGSEGEQMVRDFFDIYDISAVQNQIKQDIKYRRGSTKDKIAAADKIVSKNIHQRGGLAAETVGVAAVQAAIKGNKNFKIANSSVKRTGQLNARPDFIATFNTDMSAIDGVLDEFAKRVDSRMNAVEAFNKIGEKVANVPDGFIVYFNAKNYSLGDSFKQGFSAGTKMSFAQYGTFLDRVGRNSIESIDAFLGSLTQLAKGAIGEGENRMFEEIIAQDIAYFLFDDYDTIGKEVSGGQSIHIMDLNGVFLPVSIVLTKMADAMEMGERDSYRKMVSVSIHNEPLRYGANTAEETIQKEQAEFGNNYWKAWEAQKTDALLGGTIKVNFLKSFMELITELTKF